MPVVTPLPSYDLPMRARAAFLVMLALAATSCSAGAGVQPAPPTAPVTVPDEATSLPGGPTGEDRAAALAVAADYLAAWAGFDWERAAQFVVGPPPGFTAAHRTWAENLGATAAVFEVGEVHPADDGAGATVVFSAAVEVAGAGTWVYESSLPLVRAGVRWLVDWTPAVLHPSLQEGDTLRVSRTWPTRAAILAVDGRPIAAEQPVKVIGVVPGQIEDQAALLTGLAAAAGIDPEAARREMERPLVQPDWFVPVGSLGIAQYGAVEADLAALPGVLVRDGTERVRLPSPFADHVVGTTGVMTVELLSALGPPYAATVAVGRSGLELALERQLAGLPDQEIQRINRYGTVAEVLAEFPGTDPADVTTTLDVDVQQVAEAVIAGAPEPAAIVVLDVATGGIRAAASRPLTVFDRALGGLYPPGSAFKIITAAALLGRGIAASETVACPAEVVVGGRLFTNAGGEARGQVPFADAFAYSCNTTFAPLAVARLEEGDLAAAAAAFGFGESPDLPLTASTATFPPPVDAAEEAAAAIGQGRVLASPLHMAAVAAAVAGGGWQPPSLLADGAVDRVPLDPATVAALADLMQRVVDYGTGTAAAVAGEDVRGKTGTAEYETGGELAAHAWFVGYWNGYAFAVLIEGGGGGGRAAAPLAAELVRGLAALTD